MRALRQAGFPDARALELFAHVLGAEQVWLARLQGRDATVPVWPAVGLDECERIARENHEAYRAFVGTLDRAALGASVRYRNSAGREFDSTVEDILLHVALHGAYHRGQVALRLRDADQEPAPTDYIAFVRGAPAATRDSPS